MVEEFIHPCSFFRSETGSFLIAFWIVNINFLMSNIIITAQNHLRIFFLYLIEIRKKFIQPGVLKCLSFFTRRARRKIGIDQMHIAKIQLQNSSLIIAYFMSRTILNIVWFYFGKYSYTTVSFFLSAKPIVEVTQFVKRFVIYIFLSCFGLL